MDKFVEIEPCWVQVSCQEPIVSDDGESVMLPLLIWSSDGAVCEVQSVPMVRGEGETWVILWDEGPQIVEVDE